jgi:hypothetical protein
VPNTNHLRAEGDKRRRRAVSRSDPMKAEYDFAKAERGKFYHPGAVFSFPVYLDPDVSDFLSKLAEQKKVDIQDLVNDLLRADMELIQSVQ